MAQQLRTLAALPRWVKIVKQLKFFQTVFTVSLSHRQASLLNIQILAPRGWKTPHGACLLLSAQLVSVSVALLLSELSGGAVTSSLSVSSPLHRVCTRLVSDSKATVVPHTLFCLTWTGRVFLFPGMFSWVLKPPLDCVHLALSADNCLLIDISSLIE